MNVSPTTIGNRIETLDILRGFALLGIFIANMLLFHSPYFYIDPHSYFSTPSDVASYQLINIFVEASFYPIFAMLFGYGLNMQYEKAISEWNVLCSGNGKTPCDSHGIWSHTCAVRLVG